MCTHLCMCMSLILYNFIKCVGLWIHDHHSQDTECLSQQRFLKCSSFITIPLLPPYPPCLSLTLENHKFLVHLHNFVLSKSYITTSGPAPHSCPIFSPWPEASTLYLCVLMSQPCHTFLPDVGPEKTAHLTRSASTPVYHSCSTRLLWLRLGKWLHPYLPWPLACSVSVHHSYPVQSPSPGPSKWPSHPNSSAIGLWSVSP